MQSADTRGPHTGPGRCERDGLGRHLRRRSYVLLQGLKGVRGLEGSEPGRSRGILGQPNLSLLELTRLIVQLPLTDRLGTEAAQETYRIFAQAVRERLPEGLGQFGGLFIGRGVWNLNLVQVPTPQLGEVVSFLVAGMRQLGIDQQAVVVRCDERGSGPSVFTPVWPIGYQGRFFVS